MTALWVGRPEVFLRGSGLQESSGRLRSGQNVSATTMTGRVPRALRAPELSIEPPFPNGGSNSDEEVEGRVMGHITSLAVLASHRRMGLAAKLVHQVKCQTHSKETLPKRDPSRYNITG